MSSENEALEMCKKEGEQEKCIWLYTHTLCFSVVED